MVLQMASKTRVHPKGIIEDVHIKVGNFIIPANFIIVDYDADDRVSIILGHPILVIGGALINVRERTLKMILADEDVVFKVYKPLNPPGHYNDLWMIIAMDMDEYGVVESTP